MKVTDEMTATHNLMMDDLPHDLSKLDGNAQEMDAQLQVIELKSEEMESGSTLILIIEMMVTRITQMDVIQIELLNPNGFEKMELRLLQINAEMIEEMVL